MTVESTPLALALMLAAVGGLLSFLSPCVLPLVPGYLGFLSGSVVSESTTPPRRHLLAHAGAFVLGFALLFTVAGIALGQFIGSVQNGLEYVRWIGGIAVIVLGVHTLGIIRIPFLMRQAKVSAEDRLPRGRIVSSFLLGIFFGAGWSPCVGTILSGIFAMAATQGARAGLLFFTYALGLGIPFMLTALAFGSAGPFLRRVNTHYRVINRVSGAFLILIGVLLLTDTFARLAAIAPPIEPPFL
ncbi:MAG TPA: cytochrome c biogenesis protein CcdA [Thermomicrobiales bacterium]|nr:cytochrome c biogenesis protein CcdA [Thermomicrobiales bacterium]